MQYFYQIIINHLLILIVYYLKMRGFSNLRTCLKCSTLVAWIGAIEGIKKKKDAQKALKDIKKNSEKIDEAAETADKAAGDAMAENKAGADKVKSTEWQKAETNKAETLLSKAQKKLDEELDDVKHMNQMVLYSKVVTIRDKQLNENKRLESEWVEEQKKLDLMMEIERLKVLKEEEEREVRKHAARK